jgi:hypothetical protein
MKEPKRKPTPGSEPAARDDPELPDRGSASRKTELVLRLCAARARHHLAQEPGAGRRVGELEACVLLEQGTQGQRVCGEPEERGLTLARAKIGD